MVIENAKQGDKLAIRLIGTLNYDSANDLKNFFSESYAGVNEMIVDMSEVDYISSAGMRVILEAELVMKKRGGIVFRHVRSTVMDAFKMSGFDRFLNIAD